MFFTVSIFWYFVFLLFWTFLFYPLVIFTISRVFYRRWGKETFEGSASLIIAAYNEEEVIGEKVENCLALDFGTVNAEIFIVSDGSEDRTNSILAECSAKSKRLRIITYHPRAGKANALNTAVAQARGEVLIFSDANVMIKEKSCQFLLEPFADPEVGVVCGRVLVKARGAQEIAGESLYMQYEGATQHGEALLWSMVGVDGAFFAMRRNLFRPLATGTILDDFTLSMQAPANNMRIVYEPQAEAVEDVVPLAENEFKRKARIVAGGYQFLLHALTSGKSFSPGIWFAFFSHKILRWLAPFFLLSVFVANLFLLRSAMYVFLLSIQILFYLLASFGFMNKSLRSRYIVYLPYYFCVVNLAAFFGFFRFIALKQNSLWEKVAR